MTHQPISSGERVQILDVLRGFAILGMWVVNFTLDAPWDYLFKDIYDLPLADAVAVVGIDVLASGKFYTIFSVLFGIGFYVQLHRAEASGRNFVAHFLRRSTGLLLIALFAIALTLHVWILIDYAICGLALLLFRNSKSRIILLAAVVCFLIAACHSGLDEYKYYQSLQQMVEQQNITIDEAHELSDQPRQVRLLKNGSYTELSRRMLTVLWNRYPTFDQLFILVYVLGSLLIGFYIGKLGTVWDPEKRLAVARAAFPWLISIGLISCLIFAVMDHLIIGRKFILTYNLLRSFLLEPARLITGLGYMAGVTLFMQRTSWRENLLSLAPVGRMALTMYLMTSLIQGFIVHNWGLGYFAPRPIVALLIIAIFYPMFILFSKWWLRRFRYGPVEWFWRSITYGFKAITFSSGRQQT